MGRRLAGVHLGGGGHSIHYKVPKNAVSESLKTKIFWETIPPDPPSVHVLMHMCTGLRPPLFHNYSFRPPLDQFLNEGLVSRRLGQITVVTHPVSTITGLENGLDWWTDTKMIFMLPSERLTLL